MRTAALWVYLAGNFATFLYLCWEDWPFSWWNWIVLIPLNELLAAIWPIYWLVLRPLLG